MRHYTLVHTSARPESRHIVCYSDLASTGEESYVVWRRHLVDLRRACWLMRRSGLWKSGGSRSSGSLKSNREKTRSGPVCLIAIDTAGKCPADFVGTTESVASTMSEE